jgi:Fe-S-cluster-containing dehydrogenase component/DMSO reductase anchor subunit
MHSSATAVEEFSAWHESQLAAPEGRRYKKLIPISKPKIGEQYAFEVNLDQCTGCKSCVVACHSLNGLDEDESWRDVGLLLGRQAEPYQQTVTSACHHCADPACANGCPVLAYEKDATTGIVRHLDDQCIGCSYCILKCPYDVPKFNRKRGIVRKCDMCHGRLAEGEAPACVQACPTQAIAIRIVSTGPAPKAMLPGLIASSYTRPQTRYVSSNPIPETSGAADEAVLKVETAHTPLAVMLILTQLATGAWLAAIVQPSAALRWIGLLASVLGIAASTLHLGQPLKAWRSFLGWRKSWLSREIIAFGAFASAGVGSVLGFLPSPITAAIGLAAVLCSIMVYVDTRRTFWCFYATAGKFFGTSMLFASAFAGMIWPTILIGLIKMLVEGGFLRTSSKSAKLLRGPLRVLSLARFSLGVLGLLIVPTSLPAAIGILLVAELMERITFFKAVVAYKMPGS